MTYSESQRRERQAFWNGVLAGASVILIILIFAIGALT